MFDETNGKQAQRLTVYVLKYAREAGYTPVALCAAALMLAGYASRLMGIDKEGACEMLADTIERIEAEENTDVN